MIKQWLTWVSYGIGGVAGLLLLITLFVSFSHAEISLADPTTTKRPLPPCSFAMPQQACDAIGKAALELKFSPITLQVPDLKNHLLYYGKNGRPDASTEKPVLHFAISSNPNFAVPVSVGDRLYLLYDRKRSPPQYTFSLNNEETSLWIEPNVQGTEAVVKVMIRNEDGEVIKEPEANANIRIQERENRGSSGKNWEIGKQRVDGSLLARQKARWMGPDQFFERHGGEEYKHYLGKQRIDFVEEEKSYSLYVGLNDSIIWDDERWKVVQPSQASLKFPLMVVKKIEDRLINFELWDVGGKNKVAINLVKSTEPWAPDTIQSTFKFMGARTRSQFIFEINEERMLLSPKDWLLETPKGWIKLTTAQEIDDYVDRKQTGVLFVCDGLEQKEGKQVLKGVFFNPSRTEISEVELNIQQGFAKAASGEKDKKKEKDKKAKKKEAAVEDDDEDFFADGDDDLDE